MKKKLILGSVLVLLMAILTGCRSGENGEVYVYSYGDYYDPEIIADFEADTGIRVIQDTYDTRCILSSRTGRQTTTLYVHPIIWLAG